MKKLFYLIAIMTLVFASCETSENEPQLGTNFKIEVGEHQWSLDIDSNKNYVISDNFGFKDVISKDQALLLYQKASSSELSDIEWFNIEGFQTSFNSKQSELSFTNEAQRGCGTEYMTGATCYASYCIGDTQTNWTSIDCCDVPGVKRKLVVYNFGASAYYTDCGWPPQPPRSSGN